MIGRRGSSALVIWLAILCLQHGSDGFISPMPSTTSLSASAFGRPHLGSQAAQQEQRLSTTALSGWGTSSVIADASSTAKSLMDNQLVIYLLQTIISYGVPTVFTLIVIGFAAKAFRGDKKNREDSLQDRSRGNSALKALYDDIYGDQQQPDNTDATMFQKLLRPPSSQSSPRLPYNTGIPQQEYLKITHWNPQLDSFQYSLQKATQSKAAAAATYRTSAWQRAWGQQLGVALEPHQQRQLVEVEQRLLQTATPKQQQVQALKAQIVSLTMEQTGQQLGYWNASSTASGGSSASNMFQLDAAKTSSSNATSVNTTAINTKSSSSVEKLQQQVATIEKELAALELEFLADIVAIVGPELAPTVRTLILGNAGNDMRLLTGTERPVTQLLGGDTTTPSRPRTFVLRFPGDPTASQVETLRQEITALTLHARSGVDHVVVVLQTGGGTVTGYGLAAAQLLRIKQAPASLHLTICVEQVAASGGYMMACVADRIVASPFAVLGSIGVISDIPNAYERLQREGISFQTVTAGKYKRTLTPTKKITKEDVAKTKEDLEDVLVLFRNFVAENRPSLDIDAVATGETWFGRDALERNLCDELRTVDETLLDYVEKGYDVFEVAYKPPFQSPLAEFFPARGDSNQSRIQKAATWIARTFVRAVDAELTTQTPQKQTMAMDDTWDRTKS